jgi:hypothetical protein
VKAPVVEAAGETLYVLRGGPPMFPNDGSQDAARRPIDWRELGAAGIILIF